MHPVRRWLVENAITEVTEVHAVKHVKLWNQKTLVSYLSLIFKIFKLLIINFCLNIYVIYFRHSKIFLCWEKEQFSFNEVFYIAHSVFSLRMSMGRQIFRLQWCKLSGSQDKRILLWNVWQNSTIPSNNNIISSQPKYVMQTMIEHNVK